MVNAKLDRNFQNFNIRWSSNGKDTFRRTQESTIKVLSICWTQWTWLITYSRSSTKTTKWKAAPLAVYVLLSICIKSFSEHPSQRIFGLAKASGNPRIGPFPQPLVLKAAKKIRVCSVMRVKIFSVIGKEIEYGEPFCLGIRLSPCRSFFNHDKYEKGKSWYTENGPSFCQQARAWRQSKVNEIFFYFKSFRARVFLY